MKFKHIILSLSFSILIYSCTSKEKPGEQLEYETTEMEPEDLVNEDSIEVLIENDYKALSDYAAEGFMRYFEAELMTELDEYLFEYNNLKTDLDFESNYGKGIELFSKMYKAFYEPKTDYLLGLKNESEYWSPVDVVLSELDEYEGELGPIVFSCVAECTELDFIYDLVQLDAKAKATSGMSDDDFLELSRFNDGDYGCSSCWSWKSWFEPTWDLGGSSLIGEGILMQSITRYMNFVDKYDSFGTHMDLMYEAYMDELSWTPSYMRSKEEVLDEFNQIIDSGLFTAKDLEIINETKAKLEDENNNIQFDCSDGHCKYG